MGGWKEKKQNQTKPTTKRTLKVFYPPIKMSQAVNAQTSLPFVGLVTMLQ